MDDKSAIAAGEGEVVCVEASLLLQPLRGIVTIYFEAPEDNPAESLVSFTAQDIKQATNQ